MCGAVVDAILGKVLDETPLETSRSINVVMSDADSDNGDDVFWTESWRACSSLESLLDGREGSSRGFKVERSGVAMFPEKKK